MACGRRGAPETRTEPTARTLSDPTAAIARLTVTPAQRPSPSPTPAPDPLCLVTRERGIAATYVPADLAAIPPALCVRPGVQMRRESGEALVSLLKSSSDEGQPLLVLSGYRSYEEQQQVLAGEIRTYGEAQARRQVAPPGHSEHQLGLAADVASKRKPNDLDQSFGQDPEGIWLAANCARFGFLISYPSGKEPITGYVYEPWHIRYVGVRLARDILISGQTLTEYFLSHGLADCRL